MYNLEVFTRPTCSDCQDAKAFLSDNQINYIEQDVSEDPEKEQRLVRLTGSRMVPTFVFREQSLLGKIKKPKVLVGYEANKELIHDLLKENG